MGNEFSKALLIYKFYNISLTVIYENMLSLHVKVYDSSLQGGEWCLEWGSGVSHKTLNLLVKLESVTH